jgi:hypothetical protein
MVQTERNPSDSAKEVVRKSHPYSYPSSHDTSEYARSLEKFYVTNGSSPPALVLAMTIGIAGFDHVLKSPPFSNLTTKTMQEGYIPINSDLRKEILRRSHFLLQEIDKTKTDHPLRDNSMRLRMPQPSQWTREKRIKFLEEKNMLELNPLDLDFLRVKVGEIRDEVERKLSYSGKESGKRLVGTTGGELSRQGSLASPASALGTAMERDGAGAEIADLQAAPYQEATVTEGGSVAGVLAAKRAPRSRASVARRPILELSNDVSDESWPLNLLYDSVATRLYGVSNGSTILSGVSEETATAALEYLLNNRSEASRFLKVGHEFYEASRNVTPEEKIDKCIEDLVKFHQRKRIKVETTPVATQTGIE